MKLSTIARDCLYLNWAIPVERLPEPPAPLRYEEHELLGVSYAFASAVLFRHQGLRLAALPWLGFSYPQFNFRFYVSDGERMPAVLFRRMVVPPWVVPASRWVARQPTAAGRFLYPRTGLEENREGGWRWSVAAAGGVLTVAARLGEAVPGEGPRIGSWEASVSYFRHRIRGYSQSRKGLHRVGASHPAVPTMPVVARIEEARLLTSCLDLDRWPELHSAFLCSEIPFDFELDVVPEMPNLRHGRAPAADPVSTMGHNSYRELSRMELGCRELAPNGDGRA